MLPTSNQTQQRMNALGTMESKDEEILKSQINRKNFKVFTVFAFMVTIIVFSSCIEKEKEIVEYLNVSPTSLHFDSQSGSQSIIISSNGQCHISTNATWCSVPLLGDLLNGGNIQIYVEENTSINSRNATVVLTQGTLQRTIDVMQDGITSINAPNLNPEGAVINGVKWAGRNVDAPGTFAASPKDVGMYYQWNRKVAWSTKDPITSSPSGYSWDSRMPTGTAWEKVNDPSPAGWRVPTLEEFAKLLDTINVSNEWCYVNGTLGTLFTDKITGNIIFLPAIDGIDFLGSIWIDLCGYWSSTQEDNTNAYNLFIDSSGTKYSTFPRVGGLSVRCVAE